MSGPNYRWVEDRFMAYGKMGAQLHEPAAELHSWDDLGHEWEEEEQDALIECVICGHLIGDECGLGERNPFGNGPACECCMGET